MTSKNTKDIAELCLAGEALFGPRWQTDLARELKLSSPRRVRQWIKGERAIPLGIWPEICELLEKRKIQINQVITYLKDK